MDEIEKVAKIRPDKVVLQEAERFGEIDRVTGGDEVKVEAREAGQLASDIVRMALRTGEVQARTTSATTAGSSTW